MLAQKTIDFPSKDGLLITADYYEDKGSETFLKQTWAHGLMGLWAHEPLGPWAHELISMWAHGPMGP